MASPSVQIPSLAPDTGSEDEYDEASSWQYHAAQTREHLPRFSCFSETFLDCLKDLIVRKHSGLYDSVYVWFLAWDTFLKSTPIIKELDDLEEFFIGQLKFGVECHPLAGEIAVEEFNSMLEEIVRERAGANELLIIYYAGHSRLDVTENTTILQATRESASPPDHVSRELNWSTIENRLNQTSARHSNILYILDSGYTPSMCAPGRGGSKELLAASKDVPKSPAVDDHLFTADLLHELRQQIQATGSISISTLHARIMERQAERQIPKPYHLPLTDKASSTSIVLAPMTKDKPCITTKLRDSQKVTLCMIHMMQAEKSYEHLRELGEKLWQYSTTVSSADVKIRSLDYVRRLAYDIVDGIQVILVLMP